MLYVALLLAARLSVRQQAGGSPTDSRTCQAYPDTRTVTSGLRRTPPADSVVLEGGIFIPPGSSYPDSKHV